MRGVGSLWALLLFPACLWRDCELEDGKWYEVTLGELNMEGYSDRVRPCENLGDLNSGDVLILKVKHVGRCDFISTLKNRPEHFERFERFESTKENGDGPDYFLEESDLNCKGLWSLNFHSIRNDAPNGYIASRFRAAPPCSETMFGSCFNRFEATYRELP